MIKNIRELLGLTQSELAAKLDLTQSNISHIEQGRHSISPKLAEKLIKVAADQDVVISYNNIYSQS